MIENDFNSAKSKDEKSDSTDEEEDEKQEDTAANSNSERIKNSQDVRVELLSLSQLMFQFSSELTDEQKTKLSKLMIPFVCKELGQLNFKTNTNCLLILGEIAGSQPEELVSMMASDSALLYNLKTLLQKGTDKHI